MEAIIVLAILVVLFGVPAGLTAWMRKVSRRHDGRAWKWLRRLPLTGWVLMAVGFAVTVPTLLNSFAVVAQAKADDRATILSSGIATAMARGAIPFLISNVCFLATLIFCILGTLTRSAPANPSAAPPTT